MTKILIPTENSKPNRKQKTPPTTLITQRLRNDLVRSVEVTTFIPIVWLNRFTNTNLPTNRKSCVIQRTQIKQFVNNPPYKRLRSKSQPKWRVVVVVIVQLTFLSSLLIFNFLKNFARDRTKCMYRIRRTCIMLSQSKLPKE